MYKEIKVDRLIYADWNYKKDDDELMQKLIGNLSRNGLIENIIVRDIGEGLFEVVNGNHRVKALRQMGVAIVMVYDLGVVSLLEAKRIAIETNETRFESDNEILSELMVNLMDEYSLDDMRITMPYTDDELNNFTALYGLETERSHAKSEEPAVHDNIEPKKPLADMLYALGIRFVLEDEAVEIERAFRIAGSNFLSFIMESDEIEEIEEGAE